MRISALIAALVAFGCFVALGFAVVRHGEPAALFFIARASLGHSDLVAWWLAWSCYIYVMAPLGLILLVVAWLLPAWRVRILFSVAMLLLCWRGADFFQHVFGRPRRLDWIVKRETSFSYPSSHATIATGFYALWGALLYMSELPRATRVAFGSLLVLLAIAICWSRLALGAHYVTDLIGGALLAAALISAGLTIVPNALVPPVAGRRSRAAE